MVWSFCRGKGDAFAPSPATPHHCPDIYSAFDLRKKGSSIPEGKCVYIQAGDPGDFDGYLIAAAGWTLQENTEGLTTAIVVPERRACPDRAEHDVNAHDQDFSEKVLNCASSLMHSVSPSVYAVRGPLNTRNIIPLKFIFSEPDKYGPLIAERGVSPMDYHSMQDLANLVSDASVSSVVMDMNGSIGFLPELLKMAPTLGGKLKASGMPITVMAGVLAEAQTGTLAVPGRDPRSTMNAIYNQAAVGSMLQLSKDAGIPLLFVTNNVCNKELKFEDCSALSEALGLHGMMLELARIWYGPHLKGKCVPFDWVSFVAMIFIGRFPGLVSIEKRSLFVGETDASILVLKDASMSDDVVISTNLDGTYFWGTVDAVVSVDQHAMLKLAKYVTAKCPK